VVVGATNHVDQIDPAIRRAGRLDREIRIYLPDPNAIAGILRTYIGEALNPEELQRAANLCAGKTGADIERLVRGAKRRARNEQTDLTYQHILLELGTGSVPTNSQGVLRTAIHEAGHAIIVLINSPDTPPTISISPAGSRSGQALLLLDEGAVTQEAIQRLLVTLLAGRAAEEVVFGDVSAGAGGSENSDLAVATKLATHAELSLGLGSSGLMWSQIAAAEEISMSLATRTGAEQAVRKRLEAAYEAAKGLILEHQTQLTAIADALIECIVLSPAEVAEIFSANADAKQKTSSQDSNTHQ
jgi:ATP-dependent Zn protease